MAKVWFELSDTRKRFRREENARYGYDVFGDELSEGVEGVWQQAKELNDMMFGEYRYETLGKPADRIEIIKKGKNRPFQAIFHWPEEEVDPIAGDWGHDEDEALYLLYAEMVHLAYKHQSLERNGNPPPLPVRKKPLPPRPQNPLAITPKRRTYIDIIHDEERDKYPFDYAVRNGKKRR